MHMETYSPADAGRLLAHYDRRIGARDHIDPDGRIYNAAPIIGDIRARYGRLVDGLEIGSKTKPLADLIVTMPKGYDANQEAFFRAAYEALEERVGRWRVVCAYVHLDEPQAQPHMHFAFVPVVETPVMTNDKTQPLLYTAKDEAKNPEHRAGTQKHDSKGTPRWKRVPLLDGQGNQVMRRTATASKLFTQADMRQLHPWMEAQMCKRLGVERVGIQLDNGDKERKLSRLAHEDYVEVTAARDRIKAETAAKEAEAEELARQIAESVTRLEEHRRREGEAARELAELEQAANPSLSRGLAAKAENRGLEREESQLRSEVEEFDRRVAEAESGVDEARRGVERARISHGHAFRLFEQALNWVLAQVKELPHWLFEQLKPVPQALIDDAGVSVGRDYRAMSVAERAASARDAAEQLKRERQQVPHQQKSKGGDARG